MVFDMVFERQDEQKIFHCAVVLFLFKNLRNIFYYLSMIHWEHGYKDEKINKMEFSAGQLLFLVIKICPEYRTPYMIQLLCVIVRKVKWWLMESKGKIGPYSLSQQPQEHIQKIVKRIAKYCNNNHPGYIQRILEYLDIYIVGALEQNFVDDKIIVKECKNKRECILEKGETPDNNLKQYKSDSMPPSLAKYFVMLEQIKKSSTWPTDLRNEYITLFSLDSCYPGCNMERIPCDDGEVLIDCESKTESPQQQSIDAANNVIVDEINESTQYLQVMQNNMDNMTEMKTNPIIEIDENINTDSNQSETNYQLDINMSDNVNNNDEYEDNHWNNHNRKREIDCSDYSDTCDDPIPPRKKRKVDKFNSQKQCNNQEIEYVNGQLPTHRNLKSVLKPDLISKHCTPHNLAIKGVKYFLIKKIMEHYTTVHQINDIQNTQMNDVNTDQDSDVQINDAGDNCSCGGTLELTLIRRIVRTTNYVCCNGKCGKKK
eukprot:195583_1